MPIQIIHIPLIPRQRIELRILPGLNISRLVVDPFLKFKRLKIFLFFDFISLREILIGHVFLEKFIYRVFRGFFGHEGVQMSVVCFFFLL